MTYSHAKVQGQRSVGCEDRVETNGRTDGRTDVSALPATQMRSLNISLCYCFDLCNVLFLVRITRNVECK